MTLPLHVSGDGQRSGLLHPPGQTSNCISIQVLLRSLEREIQKIFWSVSFIYYNHLITTLVLLAGELQIPTVLTAMDWGINKKL